MSKNTKYFRNKNQVANIDPEALWKLHGNYMVLVDDDKHLSVAYQSHEHWYYEVETPKELK